MAKEQNEEWMTTSQVQRAIRKGNTDFADRLVGKVVLVRDANEDPFDQMSEFEKKQAIGVRKRVRELPLYDLSDLGKRHVIHVGNAPNCDLRPYIKGLTLDPDCPDEQGFVYANGLRKKPVIEDVFDKKGNQTCRPLRENRKPVYANTSQVHFVAFERTWLDDGKTFGGTRGESMPWMPGDFEHSYMGFCVQNGESRYKIFFIPKQLEDLDRIAKNFNRKR